MKTTATFSILFWADFSRAKNNQASIYVRITVNGKRATISLKRKVSVSDWDAHKGRSRGTNQNARILNNYLEEVNSGIFKCYQLGALGFGEHSQSSCSPRYAGLPIR